MPRTFRLLTATVTVGRKSLLKCHGVTSMILFNNVLPRISYPPVIANNAVRNTFFRYTSGRFVYNEKKQLDLRHVPFDVDALKRIATQAAGASHCTAISKTHEGSFNKIFSLTLDNSIEVIAKIPTRLVPSYKITASEVATMDYARTVLNLPVPNVLAWSPRSDEIGSEYIIMEKSSGVQLLSKWENTGWAGVRRVLEQVIDAEGRFADTAFAQIGGIYYKDDIEPAICNRPLYAEDQEAKLGDDKFCMGPLSDWDIWRGERASLRVDRGPWPDLVSYLRGRIRIEQEWLAQHAHRHTFLPEFSSVRNQDVGKHIETLEQLYALAAHITPPYPVINVPVLWHTDLHGANVMLENSDAPEPKIVDFIDWQFMMVAPLLTQARFAKFARYDGTSIRIEPGLVYPKRPSNFDSLPEDERKAVELEFQMALRHKAYETLQVKKKTMHYLSQSYTPTAAIVKSLLSASRTWFEGLHHLRETMYEIVSAWPEFAGDTPLPACVDVQSLEKDHLDYPRLLSYDLNVAALFERLQVGVDGWVANEKYEEAMKRSAEEQQKWNTGEMGGPYPLQDGAPSWFVGS